MGIIKIIKGTANIKNYLSIARIVVFELWFSTVVFVVRGQANARNPLHIV